MFRIFARWWKTSATEEATSPNQSITPTEFAWRTHSAITDWTAKVDVKASIVLALETAIMGAVMDHVEFRSEPEAGTVVHLVKELTFRPDAPLRAAQRPPPSSP